MDLRFSDAHEAFRAEAAAWLNEQMAGPFRHLKGINNHTQALQERREWEAALGKAGWSCIGWPKEFGGRDAGITEQVIFAEEYARAGAPNRVGHIGVELTGPTIIAFGTDAQKERFLPGIAEGRDVWCQGYSEPNAGSDLGNLSTKARLENGKWIINGQKIWTSLAHVSDWIFVVCRTEEGSKGPKGLSFLLVPMNQKGINVRPIRQMTGDAEFNEVFFDEAETDAENIVGAPGDGWKVAMGLLAFERGVSTLGQQMLFSRELQEIIEIAKHNGAAKDPIIRQKIADAHAGLKVMRYNALRMLSEPQAETLSRAALTYKLYWSSWHRDLGDLALDVMGPEGEIGDLNGRLSELTIMHLMSRSDTIYGGSNEIQRNIIAERGLGLPREPRGMRK